MEQSFFFYDLETSGVNPRTARIMQFAGQRTDMRLNPTGEPYNILVKITDEVLPEPDAILITGITPQQTIQDGITEAEFFKLFTSEIAVPNTTFVGFNNVRFDDEFIRYGLYRNFFDAYEWQWKDGRSKWDILDLTRMTRALRPDGINWPFAPDGKPSNRLGLLTSVNKLAHENAHDALSDVRATIDVAKLIKQNQPKLFEYNLQSRDKKAVQQLAESALPFVYVSGMYPSEYEKLAVVYSLGKHPKKAGSLVYDLRIDPVPFLELSVDKLIDSWRYKKDSSEPRLPIKTLQYNRCPAIAPISTLLDEDKKRLSIDDKLIKKHCDLIKNNREFYINVSKACEILEEERLQTVLVGDTNGVDGELYNNFIGDNDKRIFPKIHISEPVNLTKSIKELTDNRLKTLLPLYKARNYPESLDPEERKEWEKFRTHRLKKDLPKFAERLQQKAIEPGLTKSQSYLLEELQLYAESIMPVEL